MSVEFIGYIGTRLQSEIIASQGPALDPVHVEQAARIHEEGGFDRALVAFNSSSPESILVAGYAASVTKRLGLLIAHRPGFTTLPSPPGSWRRWMCSPADAWRCM
jgi:alkanesulfonate monooxygenase